jgi:hypothetical protein
MKRLVYAGLLSEYRTTEMGKAIMILIDFFVHKYGRNVEAIIGEYIRSYREQIGDEHIAFQWNKIHNADETLHFARRRVWEYYLQLASLRYEYGMASLSAGQICRDFGGTEYNVLKITYYCGIAAKQLFLDAGDIEEPEMQEGKTTEMLYRLVREAAKWRAGED